LRDCEIAKLLNNRNRTARMENDRLNFMGKGLD
jgi:hypothetical protein